LSPYLKLTRSGKTDLRVIGRSLVGDMGDVLRDQFNNTVANTATGVNCCRWPECILYRLRANRGEYALQPDRGGIIQAPGTNSYDPAAGTISIGTRELPCDHGPGAINDCLRSDVGIILRKICLVISLLNCLCPERRGHLIR